MFSLKPAVVKKDNWAFFLIWLKESFTREIYKNVKSASAKLITDFVLRAIKYRSHLSHGEILILQSKASSETI